VLSNTLTDRVERFEAIRLLDEVDADEFSSVVVDSGKDGDTAVDIGVHVASVRSPDLIGRTGQNGGFMWMGTRNGLRLAIGRQ
jgi:hypothetical protein